MIVLGIDPGLANTGYGVVARRGGRLVALDGGVVRTAAESSTEQRLGEGEKKLGIVVPARRPTLMFNGYGDQVASLYAGMDLKKYY